MNSWNMMQAVTMRRMLESSLGEKEADRYYKRPLHFNTIGCLSVAAFQMRKTDYAGFEGHAAALVVAISQHKFVVARMGLPMHWEELADFVDDVARAIAVKE